MPTYSVEQGDHLSALAERFGFRDLKSILDHPSNAALKARRKDPNVLFPGDVLFIPENREKTERVPTTRVHVFRLKDELIKLKLRLLDAGRKPRGDLDYELEIDGAATLAKTAGDGAIAKKIPRLAKAGKLTAADFDVALLIGHLDPIEEWSGQIARLNNLGYEAGEIGEFDPARFRSAVEEFQCDQDLAVDGICGTGTQDRLKQVHGS